MIEEEGGNKAEDGSEDEEGHHPQRAVSNRRGQPVREANHKIDINRSTERRIHNKRDHMPAKSANTEPTPHGICGSTKKDTERQKNSYAISAKRHSNGEERQGST